VNQSIWNSDALKFCFFEFFEYSELWNIYKSISANIWKSYLIIALFILFAWTVAYILSRATGYGPSIGLGIFIFSIIYSFVSLFYSDKIVLATIRRAGNWEKKTILNSSELLKTLQWEMAFRCLVCIFIDDPSPNAFCDRTRSQTRSCCGNYRHSWSIK